MVLLLFLIASTSRILSRVVPLAYAEYDFNTVINTVTGSYSGVSASDFGEIINLVLFGLTPLVYAIATLVVIRAGILLIIEQSQNELSQFKTAIIGSLIAVVIVSIAKPLATALYSGMGTIPSSTAATGVETELLGIIDFIEEPIAVVAIIMIMFSGIRTVLGWGGSDGLAHLKRTIVSTLIGIALIASKLAIKDAIVDTHEPQPIIDIIVGYMKIFLGFVTLAAVAVIIYAGFLMIVNVGKDEQYQRAKGIIIRVAVGIIVIIVSAALAQVFLVP